MAVDALLVPLAKLKDGWASVHCVLLEALAMGTVAMSTPVIVVAMDAPALLSPPPASAPTALRIASDA